MNDFHGFTIKCCLQPLLCLFFITGLLNPALGNEILKESILKSFEEVKETHPVDSEKAFNLLREILELTQKESYRFGEMLAYEELGYYQFLENQMENAIASYQMAFSIAEELNEEREQSVNLHHMANVYMRIGQLEKAKTLVQQAYDKLDKGTDLYLEGLILSTMGSINSQLGLGKEKVIDLYLEAYDLFDKSENEEKKNVLISNISYFYLIQGDGKKAMPYIQQALAQNKESGNAKSLAMNHGNLGYAFFLEGDYDKAFSNYQICVDIAQKNNWQRIEYDTYKDLSDTYSKSGNAIEALAYFKKYHSLRDSTIGQKTQNRIADLEVAFETKRKEQEILELQQQRKIQNLQLYSLVGTLIIIVLIAFLIYYKMRGNIRKKQALLAKNKEIHLLEKELIENQLQQKQLEQEKAKAKLAYQTKYLTDFALDIVQKNQLSNDLMNALKNIENKHIPKNVSDNLRQIRMMITSNLQINKGLTSFQENVNEIHMEFNLKLQQRFPELSSKDRVLCSLLRLNLQNKEIATIRGASDSAVKMARYRLRKKLNLEEHVEIVDFLKEI